MWPLLPPGPVSRARSAPFDLGWFDVGHPPPSRSCDLPAGPCTTCGVDPQGPSRLPLPSAPGGLPRHKPVPVSDRLTTASLANRPVRRSSRKSPSACHAVRDGRRASGCPVTRRTLEVSPLRGRRFRWRERVLVPRTPTAQGPFANNLHDTPSDRLPASQRSLPSLAHRPCPGPWPGYRQLNAF